MEFFNCQDFQTFFENKFDTETILNDKHKVYIFMLVETDCLRISFDRKFDNLKELNRHIDDYENYDKCNFGELCIKKSENYYFLLFSRKNFESISKKVDSNLKKIKDFSATTLTLDYISTLQKYPLEFNEFFCNIRELFDIVNGYDIHIRFRILFDILKEETEFNNENCFRDLIKILQYKALQTDDEKKVFKELYFLYQKLRRDIKCLQTKLNINDDRKFEWNL